MKKKIVSLLIVIAMIFTLTACMDVQATVTVNKDGSGTAVEKVYLDKELWDALLSMSDEPVEDISKDMSVITKDGKEYYYAKETQNFKKGSDLMKGDNSMFSAGCVVSPEYILLTEKEAKSFAEMNGELDEYDLTPEEMAEYYKAKLTFHMPYTVKETNGKLLSDGTTVVFESGKYKGGELYIKTTAYEEPLIVDAEETTSARNERIDTVKNANLTLSSKVTAGQIKISWKKSCAMSMDGYQVYRSRTGKTDSYTKIKTVKTRMYYTDKEVTKGKTYYYRVRGYKKINGKTYYTPYKKIKIAEAK